MPNAAPPETPDFDDPRTRTVVLMGVSGCGKSTIMAHLVARLGWPAAEADTFHSAANVAKMAAGQPLTDEDRWLWLRALATWIGEREAAGENGVVTCSALKRVYRDLLRRGHPSVTFVHLTAAVTTLERRMAQRREHYMPPSLLASQLATLEPLGADEPGFAVSGESPPEGVAEEIEARLMIDASSR